MQALAAIGEEGIAARLCHGVSPNGALALSRLLDLTIDRVEQRRRAWPWRYVREAPVIVRPGLSLARGRLVPWPPCDEDFAAIRATARWYARAGELGLALDVRASQESDA